MHLGSLEIGDFRIDAIDGGDVWMDGGAIFGVVPKPLWCDLAPPDESNRVRLSFYSLLVRSDALTVVVEGGSAVHQPPKMRDYHRASESSLPATLAQLGVDVADVDYFITSHLHFDHVGGGVEGPHGRTFPNAAYVTQRVELDEARNPMPINKNAYLPADIEAFENTAVEVVEGEKEIAPGIKVTMTGGHSVGHQFIEISGRDAALVFAGDVIPTSEHLSPRWMCAYDVYPIQTHRAKVNLLERASREGIFIAPGHGGTKPVLTVATDEHGKFKGSRVDSVRPMAGGA